MIADAHGGVGDGANREEGGHGKPHTVVDRRRHLQGEGERDGGEARGRQGEEKRPAAAETDEVGLDGGVAPRVSGYWAGSSPSGVATPRDNGQAA